MDDSDILYHIGKLVDEERQLSQQARGGNLSDSQLVEMYQIETYLDQCFDLLRQRRARRLAGLEPADARLHDEEGVEHFPQ